MKRQLFALLTSEADDMSLAALARAISYAPRDDGMPVWRAFVRTRDAESAQDNTVTQPIQRIRITG